MKTTLLDMLKSGVHFGHQTDKWHPKMRQFIFSSRQGVHIIDLEKTVQMLEKATDAVQTLASEGKQILFVGTKRQAKEIVKKYAQEAGMPYLTERWIGGFLTNFSTVSKNMERLRKLKADFKSGEMEKYKKHEQMAFREEMEKLEFVLGGVENMRSLPDALFVIDIKKERTAVNEAVKRNIPIIALVDTNTNPDAIRYPIPANDDATKSIDLICRTISEAIQEGKQQPPKQKSQDTEPKQVKKESVKKEKE